MKAFCINLDRRPDRRQHFEQMCLRAGIEVERFPGIDGTQLEVPAPRPQSERGFYGNLVSQRKVIEHARDLRLPEVMIFEDDAVFPEWFAEEVQYFLSLVPPDWGMIYFGGHGWPRRWGHVRGPVLRCTNILQTECYAVRFEAYDRVIDQLAKAEPVPGRWSDLALRDLQEAIPTYTMLNPIVRQLGDFSDDLEGASIEHRSRCDIPGWFTDAEGEEYLRHVRRFDRPVVAEIGTYKGRSASFVAETVHRRGGKFFCVDLWNAEPSLWGDFEWWMNAAGIRHCINTLRMDSIEAASFFADRRFDLVFLDSDHTYDNVKREIAAWLPKIRPGGVIMGHDYSTDVEVHPGVRWAVDDAFGKPARLVETCWSCDV